MTLDLSWADIGVRLLLAFLGAALIGLNREVRGHAAGLRTTTLVGLAAAIAMIQANVLLATSGKDAASFVTMDVMRLPLGILTGVGFIGGGAILRRGDSVAGVTTAATLWIVTVMGLCFGGGQLLLGLAAALLGGIALYAMRWAETRLPRRHQAVLVLRSPEGAPFPDVDTVLRPLGGHARFEAERTDLGTTELTYAVTWRQSDADDRTVALREALASLKVVSFTMRSESEG